jgi:hypothetical protein
MAQAKKGLGSAQLLLCLEDAPLEPVRCWKGPESRSLHALTGPLSLRMTRRVKQGTSIKPYAV